MFLIHLCLYLQFHPNRRSSFVKLKKDYIEGSTVLAIFSVSLVSQTQFQEPCLMFDPRLSVTSRYLVDVHSLETLHNIEPQ